jgi:predicted enzyme related to lactoylglutathione lyase
MPAEKSKTSPSRAPPAKPIKRAPTRPAKRKTVAKKPPRAEPFATSRDVILRTESLPEATRFYGTVLGFKTTLDQEGIVGFETGAFQLFIEKGTPPHGAVFEMYVPDLAAAKKRLVTAGCAVLEEDPRVPRCYVRDPFGLVFNVAER